MLQKIQHGDAPVRLAQGDADSNRKGIPFSYTVGRERFETMLEAEATDPISYEELFE